MKVYERLQFFLELVAVLKSCNQEMERNSCKYSFRISLLNTLTNFDARREVDQLEAVHAEKLALERENEALKEEARPGHQE